MKKTFLLALLAIVVIGGGAILAILYFTGPSTPSSDASYVPPPVQGYEPAAIGPTGPTGPTGPEVQRQPPAHLNAPAGIPMVPEPDPRAEKLEAQRAEKFESAMDAQNRRIQERIRKAGKQPLPPPQPAPQRQP
jgi:hypothetical protein